MRIVEVVTHGAASEARHMLCAAVCLMCRRIIVVPPFLHGRHERNGPPDRFRCWLSNAQCGNMRKDSAGRLYRMVRVAPMVLAVLKAVRPAPSTRSFEVPPARQACSTTSQASTDTRPSRSSKTDAAASHAQSPFWRRRRAPRRCRPRSRARSRRRVVARGDLAGGSRVMMVEGGA